MNFKLKFKIKHFFLIIYLLYAAANLLAIFYLAVFMKKYVYYAYYPERDPQAFLTTGQTSDISMDKFDAIIKNLEKKSAKIDLQSTKNLFK